MHHQLGKPPAMRLPCLSLPHSPIRLIKFTVDSGAAPSVRAKPRLGLCPCERNLYTGPHRLGWKQEHIEDRDSELTCRGSCNQLDWCSQGGLALKPWLTPGRILTNSRMHKPQLSAKLLQEASIPMRQASTSTRRPAHSHRHLLPSHRQPQPPHNLFRKAQRLLALSLTNNSSPTMQTQTALLSTKKMHSRYRWTLPAKGTPL